ncbi:MAG: DUF4831 family protein [Chlorobi bacterium]|nr:DUF4831 family protein [Chlorobiota bacterium]
MKKTIIFISVALLILLFSCKSEMYVSNVNSKYLENTSGLIYALPKTKLEVEIEITETHKQKGPFAEYTNLYFNTKNAITENSTDYRISNISINAKPVTDSANIYCINSLDNEIASLINLTQNGFIAGINISDYQSEKIETEQKNILTSNSNYNKFADYADFSLKSIRETQYDTIYKEVLQDSVIVKIPIIKKKEVYKSLKKQAKETADVLFLLRDDRNALLKGENDGNNFPDGEALKLMINELNKLEKQYMSLFTGQEIKVKKQYKFEIIPNSQTTDSIIYLFNFSENKGFYKTNSAKNAIYLKLNKNTDLISTSEFTKKAILSNKNKKGAYTGIIYRIPQNLTAEVINSKSTLYKKEIKIAQAGTLNIIPAKLLKNTKVEFYPQYGSLKRISKIKE